MDRRQRVAIGVTAIVALTGGALGSAVAAQDAEPVTLTYYTDDNNVTQARLQGLIDAYTAAPSRTSPSRSRRIPAARRATTSSRRGWRRARCPTSSTTTPGPCSRR